MTSFIIGGSIVHILIFIIENGKTYKLIRFGVKRRCSPSQWFVNFHLDKVQSVLVPFLFVHSVS